MREKPKPGTFGAQEFLRLIMLVLSPPRFQPLLDYRNQFTGCHVECVSQFEYRGKYRALLRPFYGTDMATLSLGTFSKLILRQPFLQAHFLQHFAKDRRR